MIDRKNHPVGWAMLLHELEDAREHLQALIEEMEADADYDEHSLRVDLGHIYAHLNRAWRRRYVKEDFAEEDWDRARAFPDDLEPIA
ncbi:hypothetical protein [Pseudoxanthomonas winnipegensis]|uniref:hypothetical protein n=1 Tax=Pseudoxanthomonas winnipegensis TaxID=2480810 RepID=UPI003F85305D